MFVKSLLAEFLTDRQDIDVVGYDNMSASDELNKICKMLSKQPLFYP
jgi:hypothetical protein